MKLIEFTSYEEINFPQAFKKYYSDLKIAIMDIETTGLSPEKSEVIIGGYAIPSLDGKDNIKIVQYFSEKIEDEKELLKKFTKDLKSFDLIITYNGDKFDIPFLSKRLKYHKLPPLDLYMCQSLDLYYILNKHSSLRKFLPNLKQKTVETYMNLWINREDEITGAQSINLYYEYLNTKSKDIEEKILLHNKDDLLQLTRLIKIIEKTDFHKAVYNNGFPIIVDDKTIYVEEIMRYTGQLISRGYTKNIKMSYKGFNELYFSEFRADSDYFILNIPLYNNEKISNYEEVNLGIRSIIREIVSSL